MIVKPWGYEYLVFKNDFVAIWMLQIVRKRKTSMHAHPNKKTGLILLSGSATCYHSEGRIELNSSDGVVIEKVLSIQQRHLVLYLYYRTQKTGFG